MISVCTPTKDRPEMLARAIRSVRAQTHKNWQHVIYDVSDPPVKHVVPELSRIKYAQGKPQGPAEDFNIAHSMADGQILTSLSDDDELTPDALETASRMLVGKDWLLARTEIRDVNGNHLCYRGGDEASVYSTMSGQYMLGGAVFWKKSFMKKVGPINVEYTGAADFDWYVRFIRQTPPVIIPDVLLIVNFHPGTDSEVNAGRQGEMSQLIASRL